MPFSAPKYRGPKSDHFDGKRFLNLRRTEHSGFGKVLKWLMNRDEGRWTEWREITPSVPPERSERLRVTWVNHSTMLIQVANVNVLTDPIWSKRCSPVQWAGPKRHHAPGIRFEDLPPIDAVLISHNHYDHLDDWTLKRLKRKQTFVALGNAAYLKGATDLDWWEPAAISDEVRVHCVPAQHFSSRGLRDRDANLWCGFVLETPRGKIYFAGDTGYGPHFQMIRERFGPMQLALLPIGAFRPEWFMCSVHISPQDAVRAARELHAEVSIPMHYYTFHLGDDGQDEPVEILRREMTSDARFEILAPGGVFER